MCYWKTEIRSVEPSSGALVIEGLALCVCSIHENIPNEGDYAWTGLCESVEAVVCEDNAVLVVVILS